MGTIDFIREGLQQADARFVASCDGLSEEQAQWRPSERANSIAFIVWHVARVEDAEASGEMGEAPLWVAAGWHERCGHPAETPLNRERQLLLDLPLPSYALLREYGAAAAERTRVFAESLDSADLDRPAHFWDGQPLATSFQHLLLHKNNHHGQVDLLRGLQDAEWDLPAGTGVRGDGE